MATTPRWGLRYPLGTDAPDVPLWMSRLATDLDDVAKDSQGLLNDRPLSSGGTPGKAGRYYFATDTGQIFRDHGAGWTPVPRVIPVVTALPATPADGDEVLFLADAAKRTFWHLRYNAAASGAYKWDVLSGPPLTHRVAAEEFTTSTSQVDLATVGPKVTLPAGIGGDFELDWGAFVSAFGGPSGYDGRIHIRLTAPGGGSGGTVPEYVQVKDSLQTGTSLTAGVTAALSVEKTAIPAGTEVKCQFKTNTGTQTYFGVRWLKVRPLRVG